MKTKKLLSWLPLSLVVLLSLLFILLFFMDNKYKTPPPYGRDGIISLTAADLDRSQPLFLIDGWLLTDKFVTNFPTYIGKYSNLQRDNKMSPPHGTANYKLTLRYRGDPIEAAISFPQLFTNHTISLDGSVLSQGNGGARISFTLTAGDHLLAVKTTSSTGYYSGMYHPPGMGKTKTVFNMVLLQCIAYGMAFFTALALSLFTLVLWRSAKDISAFWFGLLCSFFALYISYYFVRLLSLSFAPWWYLVQSAALYGLCFCVIRLTVLSGKTATEWSSIGIQRICGAASILLLTLALLIPVLPWAVWLHGHLTNFYYLFTFCAVLFLLKKGKGLLGWEQRFTSLACAAFGVGLVYNLFGSNLFEPILFFWQFEWCGLFLVALFACVMAVRNKRILAENEAFQNHLEELVEKRTEELSNLLQERKAFFADMAHDLKSPIYAASSFIEAIRKNNTSVDSELLHYIDLVDEKQQEMTRRVQGLTEFNKIDELSEPFQAVSVQELLEEVYQTHYREAAALAIHLVIHPPETDGKVYAQPKKLVILLENLLHNALKATPKEGKVTLWAELDEEGCHLSVADTGCGIAPDDLPHVFERFYVGGQNKTEGSGLGLYIVKSIVDSLHGDIYVSSGLGSGSSFHIDLPMIENMK